MAREAAHLFQITVTAGQRQQQPKGGPAAPSTKAGSVAQHCVQAGRRKEASGLFTNAPAPGVAVICDEADKAEKAAGRSQVRQWGW